MVTNKEFGVTRIHRPFFKKGINGGKDYEGEEELKTTENSELGTLFYGSSGTFINRVLTKALDSMSVVEFYVLIRKIEAAYMRVSTSYDIRESFKEPEACKAWMKRETDWTMPRVRRGKDVEHVSILGNLEEFGVLENPKRFDCAVSKEYANKRPAVVEFGAGSECMAQVLAHCYGIQKMLLVDQESDLYKLKADERVREKESMLILERLRIDIEHLDLNAVEFLKGVPYLAIGNHLCGSATDLTLRCCLPKQTTEDVPVENTCNLRGLAIATCCHHLCQWKHYQNKRYLSDLGFKKDDFHLMSLLTIWDDNPDHSLDLSNIVDERNLFSGKKSSGQVINGVNEFVDNMTVAEAAGIGFKCKVIIDMGRLLWVKQLRGLHSRAC
ncbi:hypothetical protein MKW94_004437 [Papaver nudicaule]|uniref:tRNA:m(4)X modification enzyme TRM13 n=1 Tax=Papaver nudicaule TaxID=74823 RepID=A0AA41W0X2_PAPNU|nr:hypothetical protein [Papaver nudicaule]